MSHPFDLTGKTVAILPELGIARVRTEVADAVVDAAVSIRVGGVGQTGEAQEHEGQLEGTPAAPFGPIKLSQEPGQPPRGVLEPGSDDLATNPLEGHGLIGKAEGLPGQRVVPQ